MRRLLVSWLPGDGRIPSHTTVMACLSLSTKLCRIAHTEEKCPLLV